MLDNILSMDDIKQVPGLIIHSHGGMDPTQVVGEVYGYHLYYRARHGEWRLAIGTDEDATVNPSNTHTLIYYASGVDPSDGYVMESTYTRHIKHAIEFMIMAGYGESNHVAQ